MEIEVWCKGTALGVPVEWGEDCFAHPSGSLHPGKGSMMLNQMDLGLRVEGTWVEAESRSLGMPEAMAGHRQNWGVPGVKSQPGRGKGRAF